MVQNTYGTKWFLVKVRNGKLWYEMVMVQNTYGTKLQFCGTKWLWCKIHMVRNGKLWYEMVMVQNSVYGQKVTGQKVTILIGQKVTNHYFNTHRTKSHKFQF